MRKFVLSALLSITVFTSQVFAGEAVVYTSEETELGLILDDPAAAAILEKYVPGMTTNEQIDLARAMTLKDIQMYSPELSDELLAKVDAEFKQLAAKKTQ